MSELATILEHEAMDFTSSSLPGNQCDGGRRASEPDMSHRGILDCIENMDQLPTDSDSQHSSSEGSRGVGESLHALPPLVFYLLTNIILKAFNSKLFKLLTPETINAQILRLLIAFNLIFYKFVGFKLEIIEF